MDESKICIRCNIEKPLIKFKSRRYGNRGNICRQCEFRLRYKKKGKEYHTREEWLNEFKKKNETIIKSGEKRCKECGEIKIFSDFRKSKRGGGGVVTICKKCLSIPKSQRKRLSNEERQKRRQGSRRKQAEKAKERYWNDSKYRERCLQMARDRHQKDRSKMLARKHKREALLINQDDRTLTQKEIKQILNKSNTCPYCGKSIGKAELDHMDPVSKAGLHSISNIIGCCHSCNSIKHTKSFIEWLAFIPEERRNYVLRLYEKKHGARPEQKPLPLKYAA